ncbi:MFS general substrate transporter [Calocera viscosa TUFC12733]|uniref:MFS general substrate transporter n=1 Tax=Calocera viscosa (strain TUFC12733) TaxID=1330018 RepID=A0A167RF06_CALVF|nr:MFS general substrate transporter [Calocera viscosa TUFC12733]
MSALEHLQLQEGSNLTSRNTLVDNTDVEKLTKAEVTDTSIDNVEVTLPEHVIPDGGLKAWSTIAGAWLVLFCTFGYVNSFGVFQAEYVEELLSNHSASDIAWIGSTMYFLLFAMGIPAGILFDAHKFRTVMIVGSVLQVGCCFALSAAQTGQFYQFFLSQGLGQGIATGLLYLPAVAVVSHHFAKRRAFAVGILFTGTGLGGVIFPILLNNVLQERGFVWAVRAAGFFMLGGLLVANLLMRTHYNPAHKKAPKPSIGKFLRDKPYVVGTAAAFGCGFGLLFYLQLYAETHGINQNIAFYTIAITNAGSAFGRRVDLVPNILADRFGPMTCQMPSLYISTALIFALFGVNDQGSLIAFCVLYGFFSGAVFSLFAPMLALMADTMAEIGIRMGLAFFVFGIAGLTGNPIIGALIGYGPEYNWWRGIVFAGVRAAMKNVGRMLMVCAGLSPCWGDRNDGLPLSSATEDT